MLVFFSVSNHEQLVEGILRGSELQGAVVEGSNAPQQPPTGLVPAVPELDARVSAIAGSLWRFCNVLVKLLLGQMKGSVQYVTVLAWLNIAVANNNFFCGQGGTWTLSPAGRKARVKREQMMQKADAGLNISPETMVSMDNSPATHLCTSPSVLKSTRSPEGHLHLDQVRCLRRSLRRLRATNVWHARDIADNS